MALLGRKAADFLVEIGTEELPPKALKDLMNAFAANLAKGFDDSRLSYESITPFASPRRLAVIAGALAHTQEDREIENRGPPVKVAFDEDGAATAAAHAFADKCGVAVEKLGRTETHKGEYLAYNTLEKGQSAADLIPGLVERALTDLPIPRRMRWGSSDTEFVRPVHWIILLHGKKIVEGTVLDIESENYTLGHRFMAPDEIKIAEPKSYTSQLEKEGFVIADFEKRKQKITAGVNQAAAEVGGQIVADDALFDEVTALTEWPVPLVGSIDKSFLSLPKEVITATLTSHQRYFPGAGKKGSLLSDFVTVANLESTDPDQVRAGNERVIRPRLADAAFFWAADQKTTLSLRQRAMHSHRDRHNDSSWWSWDVTFCGVFPSFSLCLSLCLSLWWRWVLVMSWGWNPRRPKRLDQVSPRSAFPSRPGSAWCRARRLTRW